MPKSARAALLCSCIATLSIACKGEAPPPAAPEVVVVPVEKKDVDIAREWVGTTDGNVNAQIFPKIEGYLRKQAYRDGGTVNEGDLLFEIDPRQYQAAYDQAKGNVERARAVLQKGNLDVARYTPLAKQGAVSQQELDDAVQMRAAAAASLAAASAELENARLNLEWTQVKAPISGVAGIANAQVGDLVGPTTLLTSVSQLDPIKVSVQVSEIDYLRYAKRVKEVEASGAESQPADLELILADGSVYPERGRLSVTGLDVTQTTGTIEMQALFPNPGNLLRPGQFAKVRANTIRIPGALVIPQRAVRDLQGLSQVAVVGADDKVSFNGVKLGPATGSDYVVEQGLEADQRVVVEGLQKIRDGMVVRAGLPDVAAPKPADKPAEKPAP